MRLIRGRCAIVTTLILCATAIGASPDDKDDVLAAAKTWSTALVEGDAKALRARSIGTDAELTRWEAISHMLASFQKLTDAVKATYKDKADLTRMFQKPDFGNLGTDPKVEVTGADATLTTAEGKPPMRLKKDAAGWKLLLSSMPPEASKLDPKQIAPFADAVSTTADEITAGKYPTQAEAMKAMGQRLVKLKTGKAKE